LYGQLPDEKVTETKTAAHEGGRFLLLCLYLSTALVVVGAELRAVRLVAVHVLVELGRIF